MPVSGLTKVKIAPYETGAAQLVTARSYLIDRFVPDCEIIALPPKVVAGGDLHHGWGNMVPLPVPQGLRARLKKGGRRGLRRISRDRAVFDFRQRTPQNWAHFLNNHLPVFFKITAEMGLEWQNCLIVTPADTPGYIRAAANLFGLELLMIDDDLVGEGVLFELDPWTAIRAERSDWVREPPFGDAISAATKFGKPLPPRVFLSRRATRAIANEAEVAAFLAAQGFATIYPEDLSAAEQFRLFRETEVMVAIHGAGLAPLLYRPEDGLQQLVEILPVGHMTDVYRVMCEQVGCGWIGVRGKLKPDYIRPAYDLGKGFAAFSLDSFEVDIASLELAFALAGVGVK